MRCCASSAEAGGTAHHGLIEAVLAATQQQAENIRLVALQAVAQQIGRRLVIDADNQECALAYPISGLLNLQRCQR